jgi:hypothetical protein
MNPDKILKEIETSNFGDPLIVKMLEEKKKNVKMTKLWPNRKKTKMKTTKKM